MPIRRYLRKIAPLVRQETWDYILRALAVRAAFVRAGCLLFFVDAALCSAIAAPLSSVSYSGSAGNFTKSGSLCFSFNTGSNRSPIFFTRSST